MESVEFIVIGGGMMGAPCARHLAEAGHSVALVAAPEPQDYATHQGPFGSHFDAARITRHVDADPDWARLSQRSIGRYADLERRSGKTIFHASGAVMAGLEGGPTANWTERFRAVAEAMPNPPLFLGPHGAWEQLGIALPGDAVATYETEDAGWLAPRAMRDAQILLAARAGARIHAQPAVLRQGNVVTLADGERIEAEEIIVATGPHAASDGFLPHRPKMKVWGRTIAFARLSEAQGAALAHLPSVIWVPFGYDHALYMLPPVRYPDGRLYLKIGGEVSSPRISSADDMRDWFRGGGDEEVGARLLDQLRALLPCIEIEATHVEPCAVTWTDTGFPYVGRVTDGLTILAGGNGAAAKCGDELGRLGAMVARGESLTGEGYTTDFRPVWEEDPSIKATSLQAATT